MAGTLRLESGTAPATPPTGTIHLYSKSDKKLYLKDDSGTEFGFQIGTSLTSTDDLPEGSVNLYFTAERAQDAIGSILTSSTTIAFNYDDVANTLTASISNGTITNTYIANAAAIDTTKLADGSVSNTEFQYLNGVTGNIQTQLDSKANKSGDSFSGAINLEDLGSTPATPSSGVSIYANTDERFSILGQEGFVATLDQSTQTQDRTYTLPDADVTLMSDPTSTLGDLIYRDSSAPARLPIGNEDDILRVVSGVPMWQEENLTQDFGDGSDGDLIVNGALTLSQIQYYGTLTIEAGAAINPNGYPIYCKVLDLTNATTPNAINMNGNNGGNATSGTGQAGGPARSAAILGGSVLGSTGASGSVNAGATGAVAGNAATSNGGSGGASGTSGAGGTGAAAAGAAGGTAGTNTHFGRFEYQFLRGATQVVGGAGGRGGNSGGGDGANSSRGAGGGGGGAAIVAIYAAEIITSSSTASGIIQAVGGQGGTTTTAPAAGNVGGASGAGGGGGGYIYLTYVKKTGPVVSSLLRANGGNGGNGGNGIGTGVGGQGGSGGNGGRIQVFNVTTGVGTETVGTAGNVGTVGSGINGGTGGNGGVCQVSL